MDRVYKNLWKLRNEKLVCVLTKNDFPLMKFEIFRVFTFKHVFLALSYTSLNWNWMVGINKCSWKFSLCNHKLEADLFSLFERATSIYYQLRVKFITSKQHHQKEVWCFPWNCISPQILQWICHQRRWLARNQSHFKIKLKEWKYIDSTKRT